jgi:hypothetical protein
MSLYLRPETKQLTLNRRSKPQQYLEDEMNSKASLTINKEILTVRDMVFDLLRELEIRTIFGNPGSPGLPFLTSWPANLYYVLALQRRR